MTIRALAQEAQAYTRDRRTTPHRGCYGALIYDERSCSFSGPDRFSLLRLHARAHIPFPLRFGACAAALLQRKRGLADLLERKQSDAYHQAGLVDAAEPEPGQV